MMHTRGRLVLMANQIGVAFRRRKRDEAIAEIALHIKNVWEKRMIAQMFEILDEGGEGLDELPRAGFEQLRASLREPAKA